MENRYVAFGDGEHDDTLAVQAYLNGKEVINADGTPFPGKKKQYRVTDNLTASPAINIPERLHLTTRTRQK